jgi:hypothetical protein
MGRPRIYPVETLPQRARINFKRWRNSLTLKEFTLKLYTYRLKYRFNLTPETVKRMFEKQSGLCKLCRVALKKWVIDHDHKCCPGRRSCGKCVRGLLCIPCNAMLGQLDRMLRIGFKRICKYLRLKHDLAI